MAFEFPVEEVQKCLACESKNRQELFTGFDDRYGHSDPYPVVECRDCHLAYLAIRPLEKYVPELYRRYYPSPLTHGKSKGNLSSYIKGREKGSFLWLLYERFAPPTHLYTQIKDPKGKVIVDIGSGSELAAASWVVHNGGAWIGIEVNKDVCGYLESNGFSTFNGTLEKFARNNDTQKVDIVLLSQVIEHVYNPLEFLKIASKLLKENGKIILSCPNYDSVFRQKCGTKWLQWHIPYHVSQFSRKNMEILASRASLKITKWITVTPSSWYYAQRQIMNGDIVKDRFWNIRIGLQLYLNLAYWVSNRKGRGDALVAILENS